MPDWSYRTVFRAVIFRLPAETGRNLTLGAIGILARLPFGGVLIDFLGHMRPPAPLGRKHMGLTFPTPIGLGPDVDPNAIGLPAFDRFGFGFLEVGPLTVEALVQKVTIERRPEQQAIWYPDPPGNAGLAAMVQRLTRCQRPRIPLGIRLGWKPGTTSEQANEECRLMVRNLADLVDFFSLQTVTLAMDQAWTPDRWKEHLQAIREALRSGPILRPLLLCLPADFPASQLDEWVIPTVEMGVYGVIIDGSIQSPTAGRLSGLPAREPTLHLVHSLRKKWNNHLVVIASGGVHEPEQALELFDAGADLVEIDSGLVYSGPGLPKRINAALLFRHVTKATGSSYSKTFYTSPAARSWFWTFLLGIAMLLGGLIALAIALTVVILPYDEAFVGMTRLQLAAINDRLLPFMNHDRVSLAGTMMTIGVLYIQLSWFGIRRGWHWARVAVLASAFAGFGSFFLFLGFGYFDPFHAFVTAILFQILLLALHSPLTDSEQPAFPNLREDWRWRWCLWGQLLFILHGIGLIGGGLVIAGVGISSVFVPEDLEFMQTTGEALQELNPRILPLIAHDRACFGGMLVASGIMILLVSLWGFSQGLRWLWWTLLAAGSPAYASGIGVHFAVGYVNWMHLTPAFSGLVVFLTALLLCYPYLCQADPLHQETWKRFLVSKMEQKS